MNYIKECRIEREPEHMGTAVIRFTEKMEVLSCAPLNGGHALTDTVFIMQVPPMYCNDDFVGDLEAKRDLYGLPADSVGFMTAAEVAYVFTTAEEPSNDTCVFAAATAGVTNAVCAGDELTDWEGKAVRSLEIHNRLIGGTINIIAVSPIPLTDTGKMNMAIPVIEGKAMGMRDSGYMETGTTSDAFAVVCPASGERSDFAGTGTDLGISTARSVRKALKGCLTKRGEHPSGPCCADMLASKGVTPDDIWECAEALGMNDSMRETFDETMDSMGSDPDVCSIMSGMLFSAFLGENYAICNQYEGDMPDSLVDGSMASFLASRISEDRGRDRVVDLMSMSPLDGDILPEYLRQAVYGLTAGVVGYITGFTDD